MLNLLQINIFVSGAEMVSAQSIQHVITLRINIEIGFIMLDTASTKMMRWHIKFQQDEW